ncbi:hypothetical protein [Actinobacillus pleuropneumoniae]|uniref:hypothetical protein n=1 Tax=Actinobacillus pleuropneumoniae TaxID=715 RepID=UPI003D30FEF3
MPKPSLSYSRFTDKFRYNTKTPGFIKWSKAVIARHHGNYSEAIRHYREILAMYSEATAARLQLAVSLF